MKRYKVFVFLCFTLILVTLESCEKILEVEKPANLITSDQVYESVQTANAALSALYAGLWDNSPLAGDQTGRLLSVYTDDLDFYGTTSNTGILELYQNNLIDTNPGVYSYWSNAYQKIYMANAIIEGVTNSGSLPSNERNRIKAEALLVRSILYLYLQQIFGDIPFVSSTNYTINQSLFKTSASDILNLLVKDLNESISLLTDNYRNTERIFPNRKVGQLVLSEVFMLQSKWKDAENLLKEIVQNPLYQFQNDVSKVFEKSSTHILWQLKPKNSGDATKEIVAYYFSNSAPTSVALSKSLLESFSSTDRRRQNWVIPVTLNNNTWYRSNKYKNLSNNSTEYSIIFRLEDVYLILSESLAQQGKITESITYVNAIKQRANIQTLNEPISQETLLNEILAEFRKEFFVEMGHRFFDLKRQKKIEDLSTVKPSWKIYNQLWPLPQKELLLNSNLNPQNIGY